MTFGGYATYGEYLQSDEWKATRTKIRRRARGWCERCHVRRRVDVHHLSYERLGHERPSDLIAVCGWCHQFLHGQISTDPAGMAFSKAEIKIARWMQRREESGIEPYDAERDPEDWRVVAGMLSVMRWSVEWDLNGRRDAISS